MGVPKNYQQTVNLSNRIKALKEKIENNTDLQIISEKEDIVARKDKNNYMFRTNCTETFLIYAILLVKLNNKSKKRLYSSIFTIDPLSISVISPKK